jgi:hypothetical protein
VGHTLSPRPRFKRLLKKKKQPNKQISVYKLPFDRSASVRACSRRDGAEAQAYTATYLDVTETRLGSSCLGNHNRLRGCVKNPHKRPVQTI